ncbi:transposase [Nostoc sp.]
MKIFFAKFKQYRALTTHYNKLKVNFLGAIYVAATVILLN